MAPRDAMECLWHVSKVDPPAKMDAIRVFGHVPVPEFGCGFSSSRSVEHAIKVLHQVWKTNVVANIVRVVISSLRHVRFHVIQNPFTQVAHHVVVEGRRISQSRKTTHHSRLVCIQACKFWKVVHGCVEGGDGLAGNKTRQARENLVTHVWKIHCYGVVVNNKVIERNLFYLVKADFD